MVEVSNIKWDARFLNVARLVASWSKDPSTKVGAVLVRPGNRIILATGYNGLPRAIEDQRERLEDRSKKLSYTVHAEMNACINASLSGASVQGCTLYCTFSPCERCAVHLIQIGIRRVVTAPNGFGTRQWAISQLTASRYFREAGVEYSVVDTRSEP